MKLFQVLKILLLHNNEHLSDRTPNGPNTMIYFTAFELKTMIEFSIVLSRLDRKQCCSRCASRPVFFSRFQSLLC